MSQVQKSIYDCLEDIIDMHNSLALDYHPTAHPQPQALTLALNIFSLRLLPAEYVLSI